eukprot:NODE_50_length_31184_cov_0.705099.p18 type:complete len:219 gc:universal NODE_50_length_31184_cov_0.705099:11761-12417(+)
MTLVQNFRNVQQIVAKKGKTLIAVSKKKPFQDIKIIYDEGHRDFGENYIQELVEKAKKLPKDINWHFIGHLQSNKCKIINDLISDGYKIIIHTIDSLKLAKKLNLALQDKTIDIFVQINTSGENSKSGTSTESCSVLIADILEKFKSLNLLGIMCIGAPDQPEPNPDFVLMSQLQSTMNQKFNREFKLSMGMSGDFEQALEHNSDFVRVGSKIFGERL